MTETFHIAGYVRISVDEEQDRDNTSIENQKAIISDFVRHRFPSSDLSFYEDRDRSGYTFEQREGYQAMRRELVSHRADILVIKDFSRFSRRNSRGLVELEDLRDAGVRIISIGDNIDFPNDDDWLKIQFQFLINEMPVTDASKKVKSVIRRRQEDGKWICAAPYGYIVNRQQQFELVPTEAEIVRLIFQKYMEGWGYKRIANYLTDEGIPTPRMSEVQRREAAGEESRREVNRVWAIASVQGILDNDFYIGTLRQGKYARRKINGKDLRRENSEHIVIERHHQAIIDYRSFATVRALRESRSRSNYRGVKKNENAYTGLLVCGDCGSPMFAMSRSDLKDAYRCGLYHRRGLKGCTSHHIRTETLDMLLKGYLRKIRETSSEMLEQLNRGLEREAEEISETENSAANLETVLAELREELKVTKRQRIRDIMKHPEREEALENTYDELESDLAMRIEGLKKQLELTADRRNMIIQVNRAAKTAMELFDEILAKDTLDRRDLLLLVEQIAVFEDRIEVRLKADIDQLLRCGALPAEEELASQTSAHRREREFRVNVINEGDPLEIYTEKDGEVIFKKYSPMGELGVFSAQLCESLHKTAGVTTVICDRDTIIAVSGAGKKELMDQRISAAVERIMEDRGIYRSDGSVAIPLAEGMEQPCVMVAAPIISAGDVMGCVIFAAKKDESSVCGEPELKLAQAASGFLGKQMEE